MLDRISTALVPCYLTNLKWEMFHQFADEFMGTKVEQVQADLNSLEIKNKYLTLCANRHSQKSEGIPWDITMSLSFERDPKPFDLWLGVQFAKQISRATGAHSFCDIPAEITIPNPSFFWQLSFFLAPNDEMISEIVQFQQVENDQFQEVKAIPIDLRNFELFQTNLPYR